MLCTCCQKYVAVDGSSGNLKSHGKGKRCVQRDGALTTTAPFDKAFVVSARVDLFSCATHQPPPRAPPTPHPTRPATFPPRSHVKKYDAVKTTNKAVMDAARQKALAQKPRKDMSTEEKQAQALAENQQRALTEAYYVSVGVNPHQLATSLGAKSVGLEGLRVLLDKGVSVGVPATITADMETADKLLHAELKRVLVGKPVAIVSDGATFRKEKVTVVLIESPALDQPIVVGLYAPSEEGHVGVYNAVTCAADIRARCEEFGINFQSGQVVAFAGDNIYFNGAVAAELNVPHAKCLPHALALTIKAGTLSLPEILDLTSLAGGLIYQGGTNKRAEELKTMGLEPARMTTYNNRFDGNVPNSIYRANNFTAIKKWHTTSELLPTDDEDNDVDDNDMAGGVGGSKQAAKSSAAYSSSHAHVLLYAYSFRYESVPGLIKDTSGIGDHVPANIGPRMFALGAFYERLSDKADSLVNQAIAKVEESTGKMFSQAQKNSAVTKLAPLFEIAATKALDSFNKHCKPALALLERRFRFDPRIKPTVVGDPSKEWFGALPHKFGAALLSEWAQYVTERSELEESKRAEYVASCTVAGVEVDEKYNVWVGFDVYAFWMSKSSQLPKLSELAVWWYAVPTSSISAERAFAVMRAIGLPHRASMQLATVRRELRFRVNRAVLEKLLKQLIAKVK